MSESGPDAGDLAGLDHWAAEARARDAADARIRERWLRTQAEEGALLSSVLGGLVERRAEVVVTTGAGRQVTGRLTALGRDFVALATPAGRTTLVTLAAVAWVRAASTEPADRRRGEPAVGLDTGYAGDEHAGASAASLVDVLAQAVAGRPRLTVHADAAALTGELRSVGVDLIVLATAGEPPALAYVSLRSLYEISFLDSG